MKPYGRVVAYLALIALGTFGLGDVRAQNEALGIVRLTPDEIQWGASQTSSRGLPTVVLAGDPKKAKLYTVMSVRAMNTVRSSGGSSSP